MTSWYRTACHCSDSCFFKCIGYTLSLCLISQHQHLLVACKRSKMTLLIYAHHDQHLVQLLSL